MHAGLARREMNGLTRRGRRRRWVHLIGLAALISLALSGCQPSHSSADFRVKVRLRDDNAAAVAADVNARGMEGSLDAPDPGELSVAIAEAIAIGVVTEPRVYVDEFGFQSVGVDVQSRVDERLIVELGVIAEALAAVGVDSGAVGFVSVCNASGDGGATGRWVEFVMRSSCGVWEGSLDGMPSNGVVALDPSSTQRWHVPAGVSALLIAVGLLGVSGLGPRFVGLRGVSGVGVAVAVIGLTTQWLRLTIARLLNNDSFSQTGQLIDDPTPVWVGRWNLVAVVVLVGAAVTQTIRSTRARRVVEP